MSCFLYVSPTFLKYISNQPAGVPSRYQNLYYLDFLGQVNVKFN